jgi:rhodanese-related sulfurtransferase
MNRIKFLTLEGLMEMMANREHFKLVEVLSKESYGQGHIPGAINIPLDNLEELAPKILKKTDVIVVYCANYHCHASTEAAETLLRMGFKKTLDFKGSKNLWVSSGLELEK